MTGEKESTQAKSTLEKREMQSLIGQTFRKLLVDFHQGGFCHEDGISRHHYWVALRKEEQQYAVLLTGGFREGFLYSFTLEAGDWNVPIGGKRGLHFSRSRVNPTISFSSALWRGGAYLLLVDKSSQRERKPLSKKETEAFLNELLRAKIDKKATEQKFEEAKEESPNWPIYWAKDGPPLPLPSP